MSENVVEKSLNLLSNKWKIEPEIYELHLGKRNDVIDTPISVNKVVFHIPKLTSDKVYILWKCLWPDCHNCCDRQGRLPLTKDDIKTIAKKMGYDSKAEFVKRETIISSWQEQEILGNVITNLTTLSLKRKDQETQVDDGVPIPCKHLDVNGSCKLHPQKPGVCWLYPFASWLESHQGVPVVHATFQLTGDCPGFYTSESIDDMMPILEEYSSRIFDYNMAVSRTTREGYASISILDLQKNKF